MYCILQIVHRTNHPMKSMDTYISITTFGNTCNSIASNTHQTSHRTNIKKKRYQHYQRYLQSKE